MGYSGRRRFLDPPSGSNACLRQDRFSGADHLLPAPPPSPHPAGRSAEAGLACLRAAPYLEHWRVLPLSCVVLFQWPISISEGAGSARVLALVSGDHLSLRLSGNACHHGCRGSRHFFPSSRQGPRAKGQGPSAGPGPASRRARSPLRSADMKVLPAFPRALRRGEDGHGGRPWPCARLGPKGACWRNAIAARPVGERCPLQEEGADFSAPSVRSQDRDQKP